MDNNILSNDDIESISIYAENNCNIEINDQNKKDIYNELSDLAIEIENDHLDELEKIDYAIAIASGFLASAMDIFWVGDFSLAETHEWGSKVVESFVLKIAKKKGYKGNELKEAINYLEKLYIIPSDSLTPEFGGGKQHHLRDFTHHFSIFGLFTSIFTQFTGYVIGTDNDGKWKTEVIKDERNIGKTIPEKISLGIINWFFHLVSDMAGSSGAVGEGTGIPGPIVSLLKVVSSIPLFNDTDSNHEGFSEAVSKIFNGTEFIERDEDNKILKDSIVKGDLRTEIGGGLYLAKQSIPVLLFEYIVKISYSLRKLSQVCKEKNVSLYEGLKDYKKDIISYNNPVYHKMICISSIIFSLVDVSHAIVAGSLDVTKHSHFNNPMNSVINIASRINIIGVGKVFVACKNVIKDNNTVKKLINEKYQRIYMRFDFITINNEYTNLLYSLEYIAYKDYVDSIWGWRIFYKRCKKRKFEEWKKQNIETIKDKLMSESDIKKFWDGESSERQKKLLLFELALINPKYVPEKKFNDEQSPLYSLIDTSEINEIRKENEKLKHSCIKKIGKVLAILTLVVFIIWIIVKMKLKNDSDDNLDTTEEVDSISNSDTFRFFDFTKVNDIFNGWTKDKVIVCSGLLCAGFLTSREYKRKITNEKYVREESNKIIAYANYLINNGIEEQVIDDILLELIEKENDINKILQDEKNKKRRDRNGNLIKNGKRSKNAIKRCIKKIKRIRGKRKKHHNN